jgi:hypothetical protein
MAYTLTIADVTTIKAFCTKKTYESVQKYVSISTYANNISQKFVENLHEILACNKVIQGWEQGNFTNEEYLNYLTGKGFMKVVNKIKSL